MVVGGLSPRGNFGFETGEVANHPFMVGLNITRSLSHDPTPHPLFSEFIGAAKETIREGVQRPLPLDVNPK
ncbi:MAG: hypothetical protein CM1200mP22_32740 [Dehalococcoidia bacterium]|nr:MAG: hypothetical protein CM1200mP22_32740 [Dehalococcoidia bacterium]